MKRSYILLKGKPFFFTDRKQTTSRLGGTWRDSLDGTPHLDYLNIIEQWTFVLDGLDNRGIARLKEIYKLNTSFLFTDYDEQQYTVVWWDIDFSPVEVAKDLWNIQFTLRRIEV